MSKDNSFPTELPDTKQADFMVLETRDQRESLYDPARREILRILNIGEEAFITEKKRSEKELEDGTIVTEEITIKKPIRRCWMTVPEIVAQINENNPSLGMTNYNCYYHLRKLQEQQLVEQHPPPKSDEEGKEKRVRGMYFRAVAKFFVPTTFEISPHIAQKKILPPEINQRAIDLAQRVKETGNADAFEYSLEIGGELYWFAVTMSLHDDGESIVSVVRDITQQKNAQEALRRSQERLDLAIKGADLATWDWHHKTRTLIFSDRYAEMLGYTLDEISKFANDWESLIHPDDLDLVLKRWAAHLEGKTPLYSSEHRIQTKDGDYIWILDRGRVVEWDEEGNPERAAGTQRDITREKLMEEALGASEERYQRLYENLSDGLFTVDIESNITFCSPKGAEIFGYSPDELIGKPFSTIVHPEDFEWISDNFARSVQSHEVVIEGVEARGIQKNGSIFYFHATGTLIMRDGELIGFQSMVRDITERKHAEIAIREERDRAQLYLDMAGTIFLALDTQANITMLNRRGCEIFGYESDEAIGKNWFDHVPGRVRDEVRESFKELMTEEVTHIRYRERPILTRNGEERIIAWHTNVLRDGQGNITGLISSGTDVTDEKLVMAALSESEQLFRAMFNSANYAVFILENSIILDTNDFTLKLFGCSRDELIGKNMWSISPRNQKDKLSSKAKLLQCIESVNAEKSQIFEWRYQKCDGTLFDAEISLNLIELQEKSLLQVIIREVP